MVKYLVDELKFYGYGQKIMAFRLPKEKINFYDLTFVFSGELTYTADNQTIVLKKNDAMLLPPGTLRSRQASSEPVSFVSFNFTLLPDVELPLEHYMPNSISADVKKLFTIFTQKYLTTYYHSKAKFINILNYLLLEFLDVTTLKSSNEHVHSVIKYIDEHITEKLTLQSVSQEIGLTKEYTATIFKKETGRTVTEYINERKMLLAKDFIVHSKMSLSDIFNHLGFDNYNYFSRIFKRYFRTTPSDLRNKIK